MLVDTHTSHGFANLVLFDSIYFIVRKIINL